MTITRLLKRLSVLFLCVTFTQLAFSQTKVITGTVSDATNAPIQGASVTPKGSKGGTTTGVDGSFTITVPENVNTLVVSSVGFVRQEVSITGSTVTVSLQNSNESLNDVVVTGYSTARRREITGSIASVQAKDFNKGVVSSPDQLLQGKVAGLEITNNNGQPGNATTVKIRGNNSIRAGSSPLYVIDGVPLDGRSPRPGLNANGLGNTPDVNPLIFINPADIASVDVLKDASASAIYGSRGANGVILITLKKGHSGPTRMEVGANAGFVDQMKKADVLTAGEYRSMLSTYGGHADSGISINPFKEMTQHGANQNYSVAFSGGSDNGYYRASFLASDQKGLIKKTGLEKYIGTINGQYKFLDNKLTIGLNLITSNFKEQIAPISNDAGSTGNLVSAAMNWNPTLRLVNPNGTFNQNNPNGQINPLAIIDAYDDQTNVTQILGDINAGYKILPSLEYRFLYGINYGVGLRNQQLQGWIVGVNGAGGAGAAATSNAQLKSQTFTHTLNFRKDFGDDFHLNATAGYEYWTTNYKGGGTSALGFGYNLTQTDRINIKYYDNMQGSNPANLATNSYNNPTVELQSYFIRVAPSYKDKYYLTATFRADGSTKFGSNNHYAYFPSVGAAWDINNENFMKDNGIFSQLKLRLGWGQTGNQEFSAGASKEIYTYSGYNQLTPVNFSSPDLKWETVESIDGGLDFGFLNNRIVGYFDYFDKKTKNPLFVATLPVPSSGGNIWKNLDGAYISNKGFEVSVGAVLVQTHDVTWNFRVNYEYVKNKFVFPAIGNSPLFLTGNIDGQGVSNTQAQAIANGQPIDVFYLRTFSGYDQNGIAITTTGSSYQGDPNQSSIIGLSTDVRYKKFTLTANAHGAYGFKIFNNTLLSATNLGNIINGKNVSRTLIGTKESLANPVSASTRFMVNGDYMKIGNVALSYELGNIGTYIKNASIYVSGSNLFVITSYPGFDPEVNVDHGQGGVPSLGIDYIGYPTARTFLLGVNFSL